MKAFTNHFDRELNLYSRQIIVNLLDKKGYFNFNIIFNFILLYFLLILINKKYHNINK